MERRFEGLLPVPCYYGWLGAVSSRPHDPPNFVVVNHTATDADVTSVMFNLWQLQQPRSIVRIIGISANDKYEDRALDNVKSALMRSVMRKEAAWFMTEGRDSSVSRMLGDIAQSPGFESREDLVIIGIQGASKVTLLPEDDQLSIKSLGRLVDDKSLANPNLTHHIMIDLDHAHQGHEFYLRKLDRVFRRIGCATALVVIEGSDDSDTSLVLRTIRRGHQVVVISSEQAASVANPQVATISTAVRLLQVRLATKGSAVLPPLRQTQTRKTQAHSGQSTMQSRQSLAQQPVPSRQSVRHRASTVGFSRNTQAVRPKTHSQLGVLEVEMTGTHWEHEDDDWLSYAVRHPDLAEIALSGLVRMVHIDDENSLQELRDLLREMDNRVPVTMTRDITVREDPLFETGLLSQLDGTEVPFANLNTDDMQTLNKDDFEILTHETWGLDFPRSFACVIGDLDNENLDPSVFARLEPMFFHGIARFATQAGGWIFCSGLNQGVERLLGKCVEETSNPPPMFGVCSWKSFEKRTEKVSHRPNKYMERQLNQDLPLNQSATHMLLLRGERWDDDDADSHMINSLSAWYNHSIPIYILLVGGSGATKQHLHSAVDQDIPVFVLKGTGGFADSIADLVTMIEHEGNYDRYDNKYQLSPELLRAISNNTSSTTMSSPVFVVDIHNTTPTEFGQYILRLYKSHTTLSLVGNSLGDLGCWAVSRNISTLNIPERIKRYFQRADHGSLRFTESGNVVPFVVLEKFNDKQDVKSVLLNAWNLATPELIFSVTGKAAGDNRSEEFEARVINLIAGGVVSAAAKTGAWLVSGGSNVGCMASLGQAVAKSGRSGQVPTIGVATKGRVGGHTVFDKKGKDIDSIQVRQQYEADTAKVEIMAVLKRLTFKPDEDRPNLELLQSKLQAMGVNNARDVLIKTKKVFVESCKTNSIPEPLASKIWQGVHFDAQILEPNHSHIILVKGSRWGDEVPVRMNVEDYIVKKKLMVIIGGGPNTWKTVLSAVRRKQDTPLVVFDQVGGVSEKIARGMMEFERNWDFLRSGAADDDLVWEDKEREYVREIIQDSLGGKIIRVINPMEDSPEDVERKILELTETMNVNVIDKMFFGRADVVLPLHISMLQHLDLADNDITDDGVQLLARYLEYNTSLVDVDLSDNKIKDGGAISLAKALVRNQTLKFLLLTGNEIKKLGEQTLCSIVFSREVTCEFSLDYKTHPFGVELRVQLFAMREMYSKWKLQLYDALCRDPTNSLGRGGVDEEEVKMALLSWPLHTCVRYPALLKTILEDFVTTTDNPKHSNLSFIREVPDFSGRTLMHIAVQDGYFESMELMLNFSGLKIKRQLKTRDQGGCNVYQRALLQLQATQFEVDEHMSTTETQIDKAIAQDDAESSDDEGVANVSNEPVLEEEALRRAINRQEIATQMEKQLTSHWYITKIRHRYARKRFFYSVSYYLFFLVLGTLVALNSSGAWNQDRFRLKSTIVDAVLTEVPDDSPYIWTFYDIGNMNDIWDFVMGPFLGGFWPDETLTNSFFLLGENRVVGAIRMRQQRVAEDTCDSESHLTALAFGGDDKCYPQYTRAHRTTAAAPSIGLESYGLENSGEVWKSASELGYHRNFRVRSRTATAMYWDGSGYAIDIPSGNSTLAAEILQMIQDASWIDRQTRVLFLEATLFNPNLQTFISMIATVELPATAGAIPYANVVPVGAQSVLTQGGSQLAFFVLECLFLLMALIFLLQEIWELVASIRVQRHDWLRIMFRYLVNDWNTVDIVNLTLLGVWVFYRFDNLFLLDKLHKEIGKFDMVPEDTSAGRFHYIDLGYLATNTLSEFTWLSVAVTLYWVKLLKYLTLAPSIGPVIGAIVNTMFNMQVIIFACVLLLVIGAFTLGFFVAFGQLVESYRSFESSAIQVGFTTLGDFSLDELIEVAPTYGPLIFFLVVLVGGLIMLNIFIAVVSEVYSSALQHSEDDWHSEVTQAMTKDVANRYKSFRQIMFEKVTFSKAHDSQDGAVHWDDRTIDKYQEFETMRNNDVAASLSELRTKIEELASSLGKS